MGNAKGFFIYRANVLADLCALLIALLFAAKISGYYLTGFSLRYLLEMRFSVGNLAAGLLLAALWVQIFRTRGLYAPPRSDDERAELWEIAQTALMSTVIFAAIGLFFSITLFSPLFLALLLGAVRGTRLARGLSPAL